MQEEALSSIGEDSGFGRAPESGSEDRAREEIQSEGLKSFRGIGLSLLSGLQSCCGGTDLSEVNINICRSSFASLKQFKVGFEAEMHTMETNF